MFWQNSSSLAKTPMVPGKHGFGKECRGIFFSTGNPANAGFQMCHPWLISDRVGFNLIWSNVRKRIRGRHVDKQAHWSHCYRNEVTQAWMICPTKSLMDVVASETQEHLATLHSWGGKKKKCPNSWTHFCQRHPENRWLWFQIKSRRCAERFLKTHVFTNAFSLPLYFQLSNLSSALLYWLSSEQRQRAGEGPNYILHRIWFCCDGKDSTSQWQASF